ncbi:MAG: SDR family oxidoreductase [Actinomycetota bacterium]
MGELDGRVALVTGGASGIGAATVRRLAADGASVVSTDVTTEAGRTVAAEVGATFVEHDVSDPAAWERVMSVVAEQGRLDVCVNNAGIVGGGDIGSIPLDRWHMVLDVNLTGVMLGCQHAITAMRENPGGPSGSIINVSSTSAITAIPTDVAYVASKGAVRSMSRSVAVWCGQQGLAIRCNTVIPGATDTGIIETASERAPGIRDHLATISPLGRMGTPDDLANGIAFLASDRSSFVTGTDLLVDGGALAVHPGY